ncbi:DUF1460 domain-containing protein [candidate division KSB1 bacterium]|nr:DUF1460 domain-containing protein [candidate division KSB1 bacterium]
MPTTQLHTKLVPIHANIKKTTPYVIFNNWHPGADYPYFMCSYPDSFLLTAHIKSNLLEFSDFGLGIPYKESPLGEGLLSNVDRDPFYDFQAVDCMTYVEQTLALAISGGAIDFENALLLIRHASPVFDFGTRNHFIVADWIPNNRWLLQDVTRLIGDTLCETMTKTIDRQQLLNRTGYASGTKLSPQKFSISYIPKSKLQQIAHKIEPGDIVCEITYERGIFVSHLGFIIRDDKNELQFRNASFWSRKVIDQPFSVLIRRLIKKPHMAGILILRIGIP